MLDSCEHLPVYQSDGAAGLDICAACEGVVNPSEIKLIGTGLFLEIPSGYEGQVRPRSGLAIKHGIGLLNSPGTIDSDYRGEISIIAYNASDKPFYYEKGARLAQLVFCKVARAKIVPVNSLSNTKRQNSGFGSTGI